MSGGLFSLALCQIHLCVSLEKCGICMKEFVMCDRNPENNAGPNQHDRTQPHKADNRNLRVCQEVASCDSRHGRKSAYPPKAPTGMTVLMTMAWRWVCCHTGCAHMVGMDNDSQIIMPTWPGCTCRVQPVLGSLGHAVLLSKGRFFKSLNGYILPRCVQYLEGNLPVFPVLKEHLLVSCTGNVHLVPLCDHHMGFSCVTTSCRSMSHHRTLIEADEKWASH